MAHKVLVLVEGPTEEGFVKRILTPYFSTMDIYLIPTIITTKVVLKGPNYKGGVNSYNQIKKDLIPLLNDSSASLVTTMIDFYGLPSDFPGYDSRPNGTCFEKIVHLEKSFFNDISSSKFLPYLQLHEFEALIFANEDKFEEVFIDRQNRITKITTINEAYNTPEEINDNPLTAPSKRLKKIFNEYDKVLHSQLLLQNVDLQNLRTKCNHFNEWITKLENI